MLIAIAVICTLCEAVFTALEVALGAVSRARLRTLIETERALQAASPTTSATAPGTSTPATSTSDAALATTPAPSTEMAPSGTTIASRAVVQRAVRTLRVLENRKRLTLLFITVTSASLWAATVLLTWQSLSAHWPQWVLPLALVGVLF
ncbi:MAG: hypothetical protein JOZ57_00835, partial [Abitibacteriaceae bacterium]|nr:hypothetical protein [Abditibacteriaceae bacterium]